jgi:hypothetical protein
MYTQISIEDPPVYETVPQVLARVELHASSEWKQCYKHALSVVCGTRRFFTADDVADVMKEMYPDVTTHDKRAAGAMLKNAARDGWCKKTGRYLTCTRENQHACPKAEWESIPQSSSDTQ